MIYPIAFGLVVRQHTMVEACSETKLLTSWPGRKNEGEECRVPLSPSRAHAQ
jgi:hypothetical protein